ncbi:MAG: hypothetical protein JJD97_01510 [Gemmatimonadaceae bacterium]|nr:hypothetical protein [Gemmatimonadaceae bacterium]
MAARVRILELERIRERLDAREKERLESLGLRLHAYFESLLVVAVVGEQPALLERLGHARAHLLEHERLRDVVHRAEREAGHRNLDFRDGGDHHDRDVGIADA